MSFLGKGNFNINMSLSLDKFKMSSLTGFLKNSNDMAKRNAKSFAKFNGVLGSTTKKTSIYNKEIDKTIKLNKELEKATIEYKKAVNDLEKAKHRYGIALLKGNSSQAKSNLLVKKAALEQATHNKALAISALKLNALSASTKKVNVANASMLSGLLKLSAALYAANLAFNATIKVGTDYNTEMDNSLGGLKAMVAANAKLDESFQQHILTNGKLVSGMEFKDQVTKESINILTKLKKINVETTMGLTELVNVFRIAKPAMDGANWSLNSQLEVVKLVSNAAANFGIEGRTLTTGIDDMARATWKSNSEFGKMMKQLGVTKEEFKATGFNVEWLIGKLKEAGKMQNTWANSIVRVTEAYSALQSENTDSYFAALKEGINTLTIVLNELRDDSLDIDKETTEFENNVNSISNFVLGFSKFIVNATANLRIFVTVLKESVSGITSVINLVSGKLSVINANQMIKFSDSSIKSYISQMDGLNKNSKEFLRLQELLFKAEETKKKAIKDKIIAEKEYAKTYDDELKTTGKEESLLTRISNIKKEALQTTKDIDATQERINKKNEQAVKDYKQMLKYKESAKLIMTGLDGSELSTTDLEPLFQSRVDDSKTLNESLERMFKTRTELSDLSDRDLKKNIELNKRYEAGIDYAIEGQTILNKRLIEKGELTEENSRLIIEDLLFTKEKMMLEREGKESRAEIKEKNKLYKERLQFLRNEVEINKNNGNILAERKASIEILKLENEHRGTSVEQINKLVEAQKTAWNNKDIEAAKKSSEKLNKSNEKSLKDLTKAEGEYRDALIEVYKVLGKNEELFKAKLDDSIKKLSEAGIKQKLLNEYKERSILLHKEENNLSKLDYIAKVDPDGALEEEGKIRINQQIREMNALGMEKNRIQAITLQLQNEELAKQETLAGGMMNYMLSLNERAAEYGKLMTDTMNTIEGGITSGLNNWLRESEDGLKSFKDAAKDTFKSILRGIQELIVKQLVLNALQAATGGITGLFFSTGGSVPQNLATGGTFTGSGKVPGYDASDSDKVNAKLTGGEFVIKRSAVDKYGLGLLTQINNKKLGKYANGGLVSPLPVSRIDNNNNNNNNNNGGINVTIINKNNSKVSTSTDSSGGLLLTIEQLEQIDGHIGSQFQNGTGKTNQAIQAAYRMQRI